MCAALLAAGVAALGAQIFRTRSYPPETYIVIGNATTVVHAATGGPYREYNPIRGFTLPATLAGTHILLSPGRPLDPIRPFECNLVAFLSLLVFLVCTWGILAHAVPRQVAWLGGACVPFLPLVRGESLVLAADLPGAALFAGACWLWWVGRGAGRRMAYAAAALVLAVALLLRHTLLLFVPALVVAEAVYGASPSVRGRAGRSFLLGAVPVLLFVWATVAARAVFGSNSWGDSLVWFAGLMAGEFRGNVTGNSMLGGEAGGGIGPLRFLGQAVAMNGWVPGALLAVGVLGGALRFRDLAWGGHLVLGGTSALLFCAVDTRGVRHLLPASPFLWALALRTAWALTLRLPSRARGTALVLLLAAPTAWGAARWHVREWDAVRTRGYAGEAARRIARGTRDCPRITWWGRWVNVGLADRPGDMPHLQPSAMSALVGRPVGERYGTVPSFYEPAVRPPFAALGSGRRLRGALPFARAGEALVLPWTYERETWVHEGLAFEILRFRTERLATARAGGVPVYVGSDGAARALWEVGTLRCDLPDVEVYADGLPLGHTSVASSFALASPPEEVVLVHTDAVGVTVEDLMAPGG
ncbi:MAG: hypothetical protein HY608_07305 [Planctomycetes bacterium]|nr:hypothetical protein [Planctomycetota bacterium]